MARCSELLQDEPSAFTSSALMTPQVRDEPVAPLVVVRFLRSRRRPLRRGRLRCVARQQHEHLLQGGPIRRSLQHPETPLHQLGNPGLDSLQPISVQVHHPALDSVHLLALFDERLEIINVHTVYSKQQLRTSRSASFPERFDRSLGDQLPFVDDQRPAARHLDLRQDVSRKQHRVLLGQFPNHVPYLEYLIRVQAGRRLVQD